MNTYQPEDTKVVVNGSRIGGFIEGGFLTAGLNSIVLRLNAFSESIVELNQLIGHHGLSVDIESGLFKEGKRCPNLDINEIYQLTDTYTKYNVDGIPEVVFVFGRP